MTCSIHHCPKLGKGGTDCKLCNNLSSRWSTHQNLDGYKVKDFEKTYYKDLPPNLKGSSVEEAHALVLQEFVSRKQSQDAGASKRKRRSAAVEVCIPVPRAATSIWNCLGLGP